MATVAAQQHEACPWCQQPISRAKYLQIETRIRDEQKAKLEAALAEERELLRTRMQADRNALELQMQGLKESLEKAKEEKAEFDRRLKETQAAAAAAERKRLEAEFAAKRVAEREHERELLKSELVKKDGEHQKATKVLLKQIAELERRVAEQANEKPEVVDINVVEELKRAFKNDRVLALPKADKTETGGNAVVEVKFKNNVFCGKILIDTRARRKWSTQYATKLHADSMEQGADHAILCTLDFPKGVSELHRHDDVLVVHPARVVEIVAILRDALLRMHKNKLSNEQRTEKKTALYEHITSEAFRRKLAEVSRVTDEVGQIDADEQDAHRKVWEKRGRAMQKLAKLQKQVVEEIDDIVDGIEDDDGRGN
ncbi:MAG: DUF2130 domain-containing protein [Deltaproteobacteria bacterium]|nr:DUF2130 domain-containing protein [Deltaproteobacteria bacterium]